MIRVHNFFFCSEFVFLFFVYLFLGFPKTLQKCLEGSGAGGVGLGLEYCVSSIVKWGAQLKTAKRKIRNYMILELQGTKK